MATVEVRGAFAAMGMSLKDEQSTALALRVGKVLGIASMEELAEEYEVFHINRGETGTVVTAELLGAFRDHLQSERAKEKSKLGKGNGWHTYTKFDLDDVAVGSFGVSATRAMGKKRVSGGGNNANNKVGAKKAGVADDKAFTIHSSFPYDGADGEAGGGAKRQAADVPELQPSKKSQFGKRANSGATFSSLAVGKAGAADAMAPRGDGVATYKKPLDREGRGQIQSLLKGPGPDARFMFDTQESRQKLVEERMQRLVDLLEKDFGIVASNSVYNIANEPVVVVGRVCNDSAAGRINEASILIEGTAAHSQGMKVRLDTSKLKSLTLFPGQVVAVEGINPSGHCITALSVLTGIPQQKPKLASLAEKGGSGAEQRSRKIAVASGPFTVSDDFSFEPLKALVETASKDSLDLLVLCGPFVDKDHPLVRKGEMDITFEDVFKHCCDTFARLPPATRVVLVPSVRDVHHDPVFPQPAFRAQRLGIDSHQPAPLCVSNPAMVACKGLSIGATSHDILKHLSATELHRQAPAGTGPAATGQTLDRMSRLALHLLQQRTFYPLSPQAPGTCLDSKLALETGALFMPATPDVLVLPSDLNPFAKEVVVAPTMHAREGHESVFAKSKCAEALAGGSCVCINPGRLAKASTGGTFSTLVLSQEGQLEKVDITRI